MSENIQQIILSELRDFRKDTNTRLASLEDSRAEGRGVVKMLLSSGLVAAAVSWFTGNIHN